MNSLINSNSSNSCIKCKRVGTDIMQPSQNPLASSTFRLLCGKYTVYVKPEQLDLHEHDDSYVTVQ